MELSFFLFEEGWSFLGLECFLNHVHDMELEEVL